MADGPGPDWWKIAHDLAPDEVMGKAFAGRGVGGTISIESSWLVVIAILTARPVRRVGVRLPVQSQVRLTYTGP
jgi:hypothetical protein